jgi:hypothetical protein
MGQHLTDNYATTHGVMMTLGHLPDRPLMTLRPEICEQSRIGKPRTKQFNTLMVTRTLNHSQQIKTGITDKLASNRKDMHKDLRHLQELRDVGTSVLTKEFRSRMDTLMQTSYTLQSKDELSTSGAAHK